MYPYSASTTPPGTSQMPHSRPFIPPSAHANTGPGFTTPTTSAASSGFGPSVANHPNYQRLRSRGYTHEQIQALVQEHLQRPQQLEHSHQHVPAQVHMQRSSHLAPQSPPHQRIATHVPVPPTPSVENSAMFRYETLANDRRMDTVPISYQQPPQMAVPRATMHLQTKPDKSAIEEVYQNAYQSRQQEVPREQIAVQQPTSRDHPILPPPIPITNPPLSSAPHEGRSQHAFLSHAASQHTTTHTATHTASHDRQPAASASRRHAEAAQRRKAFEAEMNRMKRDEAAAFELLEVPRQYDLTLLAKQYRKAALKYHPDRVRRHAAHLSTSQLAELEQMFEKVTKAYLLLMERYTQQEENRPFYELRKQSRTAAKEQQSTTRARPSGGPSGVGADKPASGVRLGGSGDQFDRKLFNKIYNDHRLHAPSDDGHGDWFQSNSSPDFDPENPPKRFSSRFNKDIFNTTFEQLKRDDPNAERQLVKRSEMGVVVPGTNTPHSTLGEGRIGDYGGNTASLQYSDLKSAHSTHATLIDAKRVQPENPTFRSIEDLEAHRSQVSHRMSPEETARQALLQKAKEVEEEARRERVRYMDQLGADQERRLGQLLLK